MSFKIWNLTKWYGWKLPIHSNIFPSKKELQQQNLTVDLYRIEGMLRDDNHFRNLGKVKSLNQRGEDCRTEKIDLSVWLCMEIDLDDRRAANLLRSKETKKLN